MIVNAINKKEVDAIVQIVQAGFDVNTPVMDCGVNLLMHAATTVNGEQMQQLMQLNPNFDARDRVGRSALHFACRAGNT